MLDDTHQDSGQLPCCKSCKNRKTTKPQNQNQPPHSQYRQKILRAGATRPTAAWSIFLGVLNLFPFWAWWLGGELLEGGISLGREGREHRQPQNKSRATEETNKGCEGISSLGGSSGLLGEVVRRTGGGWKWRGG